mgnify:FL=1
MKKSVVLLILMIGLISQAQLSTKHKQLIGKDSTHLKSFEGHHLTSEAGKAYYKMKLAAFKDSINIKLVSAFRSYERQKQIWNRKYKYYKEQGLSNNEIFDKITDYSTIPGTSRHHWGTEIDIIAINGDMPMRNVLNEKHFNKGGAFHKMYQWLQENAEKFGFCEVYTDESTRKGFEYEPWHYSYEPQSKDNLKIYINHNLYDHCLNLSVNGLEKIDKQLKTRYLEEQILDINPSLKVKK